MSLKSYLTPILLLLISTSSYAEGFYIGAGMGPSSADFKQDKRITSPGNLDVKDIEHHSGTGIFGSIFGGYAWQKNALYLAGEINADANSVEFESSNYEYMHSSFSDTSYRIKSSFGISVLPGYYITDTTLLYGRVGYANGYFKISTTDSSLANVRRNLSGLRYGLGVNQSFTQHFGARMEYSQVNYQHTNFTIVDDITTIKTQVTPNTSQVEFSLIYKFG